MRTLLLVALASCGSTAPAQTPPTLDGAAEAPPPTPFVEAAHTGFPTMPANNGDVLANANLVIVTFAGYTLADGVEATFDWIPTSSWLATVGAQYGVGTPSVLAKVRLATSPPSFTSTPELTAFVTATVGTAGVPAPPGKNTFYAFVLPAGTPFTDPQIGTLCDSFTGYHDATATYTFAAIGTCPNHVPGLTDAEQVERVLSHELIEALTDPFGDGYAFHDPSNPWSYVGGGEVADVCNDTVRLDGFLAVQSWSNTAVIAGQSPCQPADPNTPYFDVSPALIATEHVAAGATLTLPLTAWSTAPTADWVSEAYITPLSFTPSVELLPSVLNNGDTPQLSITVPSSATSGSVAGVFVHSFHVGDASYTLQPVVVTVQ